MIDKRIYYGCKIATLFQLGDIQICDCTVWRMNVLPHCHYALLSLAMPLGYYYYNSVSIHPKLIKYSSRQKSKCISIISSAMPTEV